MANLDLTSKVNVDIEQFRGACTRHAQFCVAFQTLLENGADRDALLKVFDGIRVQSEDLEGASRFLASSVKS